MIKYKSTRGGKRLYSFSEVILKGIAEDGGLFVPEKISEFSHKHLQSLIKKSYQEQANFILGLFKMDIKKDTLEEITNKAYSSNFDTPDIAPISYLKSNQYILELWHGPTSAFKDMALQITPLLFQEALKRSKKPLHYLILVATSGDTGKAALEGFKDKERISIIVFYPDDYVSKLQKQAMITQVGSNVGVYAIKGNFDAVQNLVKDIFNDKEFNRKLTEKYQTVLSSANSINWGRLMPQTIYHINSYLNLVKKKVIVFGEQVDICVPTGNFGNILAAFYAKKMGLPIRKLICASNANNVLTEFLKTGIYDIKSRKLLKTPSPSMDILIASNVERLLYTLSQDPKKVAEWMEKLKMDGRFEVDEAMKAILQEEFFADWVTNEECLQNIKMVYDETKYLMDPHTSCAQAVAERYIKQNSISTPVIICSTAHWAKFAKDVYKALNDGKEDTHLDEFKILEEISKLAPKTSIPKSISSLKTKRVRFKEKCEARVDAAKKIIIHQLSL